MFLKTSRFHFAVVCSVIDVPRTSQHGKNTSEQLDVVSCAKFMFSPCCDVICAL